MMTNGMSHTKDKDKDKDKDKPSSPQEAGKHQQVVCSESDKKSEKN
ncbi:hypothetical protein Q31b_43270 [Novipirellula aureliae]|uniref:Uncharacterized protein n=1 Tax=Novipirellula aureliae TaxID=2527966 RepID=A0A5C6DRZ7_9BACT|nr:hypothetical protein [Novipirellula aureliae]TWU37539.1 hypothetical protein Q31b_43270 [Novipirellula aureliae]